MNSLKDCFVISRFTFDCIPWVKNGTHLDLKKWRRRNVYVLNLSELLLSKRHKKIISEK